MSGRTKPHRRIARVVTSNALERAINAARRLSAEDVAMMISTANRALQALLLAQADAGEHWRSLADLANVAETLAGMGVGGGPDAQLVIRHAQEALAWLMQERRDRGTWALRADERAEVSDRLTWLVSVHAVQMQHCSYGEFERAWKQTYERVRQARAGNAPADAVVVEGLIA